jgi:tetratricopeptide (TPR) repeat protein
LKKASLIVFLVSSLALITNILISAKITIPLVISTLIGLIGFLLSLLKDIRQHREQREFEFYVSEKIKDQQNDDIEDALAPFINSYIPKNEIKGLSETERWEVQKIDKKILLLLQKSRFDEVEKILNVLNKKYRLSFIRKRYGDLYLGTGDFQLSIKNYKKALSLNNKNHVAREYLAIVFSKIALENMGTKKAIFYYKKAIETNELFFSAHYNLGIEYAKMHNKLAIQSFDNALKINPKAERVYISLGQYYSSLRNYTAAEESYNQALKLNKNNTFALECLGYIFLMKNDLIEAGRFFQKVLTIEPDNDRIKKLINDISKIDDSTEIELIGE